MRARNILLFLGLFSVLSAAVQSASSADTAAKRTKPERTIPLVLFVDSSLIKRYPTSWQNRMQKTCDTASACFSQEFNTAFEIAKVITVRMERGTSITVDAAFTALASRLYPGADTISVLLYSDTTIEATAPLGETELGKKQIAIREIPFADTADIRAWSIVHALTLLHEIGHSFGAIHVSDAHSVMNHSPGPVGTFMYDSLNSKIITYALRGDFGFSDHSKYIETVSRIVQETKYYLGDYPDFFQRYLSADSIPQASPELKQAIGHDSFLIAAFGLRMLAQDDSLTAIGLFDEALKHDSLLAAPWYYRGLATTDTTVSNQFLTHAAKIGYYLAQELLYIRKNPQTR